MSLRYLWSRERYPLQIRNHILPVFRDLMLRNHHAYDQRAGCLKKPDCMSGRAKKRRPRDNSHQGWIRLVACPIRGILSGIFTKARE